MLKVGVAASKQSLLHNHCDSKFLGVRARLTREHRRVSLSSDGHDEHVLPLRFHGDEVLVAAQGLRGEAHHVLAAHPGRHNAAVARKPPCQFTYDKSLLRTLGGAVRFQIPYFPHSRDALLHF